MTGMLGKFIFCLLFTTGAFLLAADWGNAVSGLPGETVRAAVQLDPETEQLDQVSEPIGELSEPVEGVPTEPLDAVSESDDEASEEVGADSETLDQASEILPSAPEGEETGLEEESPAQEMPLGDREAEGRGLGY